MYYNDLTPATRAMLGAKYRVNVSYAGQLAGAYSHARNAQPKGTLLIDRDDAQAEVEHVGSLYAQQRKFVTVTVRWGDYKPGQVITLTYPRYGFENGVAALIVSASHDYIDRTVRLTLWT